MQDVGGQQGAEPPGTRSGSISSATKLDGVSLPAPRDADASPGTSKELIPFWGVKEVMILRKWRSGVWVSGGIRPLLGGSGSFPREMVIRDDHFQLSHQR